MNVLPCELAGDRAVFAGIPLPTPPVASQLEAGLLQVGVRPEFVRFDAGGFPVEIAKVDDLGRYRIVEVRRNGHAIKMIVGEDEQIPSESARISFDPERTRIYANGWMVQ